MSNAASSPSHVFPLTGRIAIVTGASRGIGRAIASHLASLGANLVLDYATNFTRADQLASEINSSGTGVRAVTARVDVSVPDDIKSLLELPCLDLQLSSA